MLFGISALTSCAPKFWHMYMITYSNFMVIVEPCPNIKTELHFKYYISQSELDSTAMIKMGENYRRAIVEYIHKYIYIYIMYS